MYHSLYWNTYTNVFDSNSKELYTYDAKGNELTFIYMFKDYVTDALFEGVYRESKYDANGNKTEILCYNRASTTASWINQEKVEYSYDANNNQIKAVSYSMDLSKGVLVPNMQTENTYEGMNKTVTKNSYWEASMNMWVYTMKEEMGYNALGKVINEKRYSFNISDYTTLVGDWFLSYVGEYEYDSAGNQTFANVMVYDMMSKYWYGQDRKSVV